MIERDEHQLREMGANQKIERELRHQFMDLREVLINSYDEVEFHLKLVSLGSCSQNQQLIFEKM